MPCAHLLALVYGCFSRLPMSVSEKDSRGPRKSSRTVVTSKSSQKSKSVRSDSSDSASAQQLFQVTSKGRSLTSVTPLCALPSKSSSKQQGFNAVVNNDPLFKPDMPVSSRKPVSAKSSRPETPKVGPTATAQRDPVGLPVPPVPAASFCPSPSTDADAGTVKLKRGTSGSGSSSRGLTASTPGQILQTHCEQLCTLYQVRLHDQHSDLELGSPPDRMYPLHSGTGSGTSPSASAGMAMQGEVLDIPPPVLSKEESLSFPAVGIVEHPVSNFGFPN